MWNFLAIWYEKVIVHYNEDSVNLLREDQPCSPGKKYLWIRILYTLTAHRSSLLHISVLVSPICELRFGIFLRRRTLLLLLQDCALSCCADAQLCCELSVRLRSEREISDIQRGERRTKGGGRCRGKSSCFSAAPPSTHREKKTNRPIGRPAGAAFSAVKALAVSAPASSSAPLWRISRSSLLVMG